MNGQKTSTVTTRSTSNGTAAVTGGGGGGGGGQTASRNGTALNGTALNGTADHHVNGTIPRAMKQALDEAARTGGGKSGRLRSRSETPSVEDYDEISQPPAQRQALGASRLSTDSSSPGVAIVVPSDKVRDLPASLKEQILAVDDGTMQEMLGRGSQRARDEKAAKRGRGRFRDAIFSRQYSTFDRQSDEAANSPFHGFYTLFWILVFLYMLKIGGENVMLFGNPFGKAEVMGFMFLRDLPALFIADAVMCALTAVSWGLQRLVHAGYIDWDRTGWILQNVWQTLFIGGVIELTLVRDWQWTHTVFFVLHGLVMLMKQHSYAFYNGYLSSQHKQRANLLSKLEVLESMAPVQAPSRTEPPASAVSTSHLAHPPSAHQIRERRTSIPAQQQHNGQIGSSSSSGGGGGPSSSHHAHHHHHQAPAEGGVVVDDIDKIAEAIRRGQPLDADQIHVFERVLRWEIDALTDELKGKSTAPERAYPNNLTLANQYEYNLLPTLVYELEYPRSDAIRWGYAAEKAAATVGIIFVMIMVSQRFIYPVVVKTVEMKEMGLSLADQFREFPWILGEFIFPFMLEYLMTWYLIWETILNLLAELTHFADRSFYGPWWNSVSWDQFARDWNKPVHMFLLRHVYHSSISAMKVNKHTATLITFFLSACVHELVMWCIFKKLRGYLLMLQMCQLPLVRLSRTKWLRGKESLGNMFFWLGICSGPSILCSLYLLL